MPDPIVASLASVIIVSLISFVGALTVLVAKKKLGSALLYFVGFSAGALFGDALLHLLPEAAKAGFAVSISMYVLLGIVVSFLVEKLVHWKHVHTAAKKNIHNFAYMNLFGDAVHNFIDGVIIAASYLVSMPIGIATTLAVIFHEIPQEIGDFGVLIHGGFRPQQALFLNFLSAVLAIAGAAVAIVISSYAAGILLPLLAFSAGTFIYIAGADLIPELHKRVTTKSSVLQLVLFLAGIAVMYALLFVEV